MDVERSCARKVQYNARGVTKLGVISACYPYGSVATRTILKHIALKWFLIVPVIRVVCFNMVNAEADPLCDQRYSNNREA